MSGKSQIVITVSLCVLSLFVLFSCSQNKNVRYLKAFCQVLKTKHYIGNYVLDMEYSFAVCNGKGTVLDKIADRNTSFTPKGGAVLGVSGQKKTGVLGFNLVIIAQDNDRGIFVFDIIMRYKGKIYQAKVKKLVPFDGKKTEILSLDINEYVKDRELLKKLARYFTEQRNYVMSPPYPLDKEPVRCSSMVSEEPIDIHSQDPADIQNRIKLGRRLRRRDIKKECRAPQFKKYSLEKYFRDEEKGLNIKDSTNVERIKKGLEPVLYLSRKPITWEINPKRKTE